MAHLVEDITKYFVFEDTDIDNWHFKLYSKGCVILFFAGSMVGVMSQYFGEPIQCDFKGVDGETAKDYCWIHGSGYIPPQYQMHMDCIADQPGGDGEAEEGSTAYYQWVTFMQLFQAGLFMLPTRIWKSMEGGLLESFGTEGKSVVMLTEEAKYDDGIVMEVVVEKFVKYFRTLLHHNNKYFYNFLFCELMNFGLIYFNFWATDQFLQGRFKMFGWEVIYFYSLTKAQRKLAVNPFCRAFPKVVSCDVPTIGASGREQWHNGLCILSQNIINEKMYLVLWFYLVFVMFAALFFLVYRVATLLFEPLRFYLLYYKINHKYDDEIRKATRYTLDRCHIGDWFVLVQLCRNVNVYFYREFIKGLARELEENPKMRGHIRTLYDDKMKAKVAKKRALYSKSRKAVPKFSKWNHTDAAGSFDHLAPPLDQPRKMSDIEEEMSGASGGSNDNKGQTSDLLTADPLTVAFPGGWEEEEVNLIEPEENSLSSSSTRTGTYDFVSSPMAELEMENIPAIDADDDEDKTESTPGAQADREEEEERVGLLSYLAPVEGPKRPFDSNV